MIRWLVAGSALMMASAGLAGGEREFAERMLERLQAAAPDKELRLSADDPLAIDMKHEGMWGAARINLHRLHAFCAEVPAEECEGALANFATRVTARPPEPKAANLRVVVRNQTFLDHLLETQPEDAQPIYRRIGDDLFALLGFAGPSGVAFTIREQLQSLGLDNATAWRLADEQTRAVLPDLPYDIDLAEHAVSYEEYDFLPSLLADAEGWRRLASKTGPDLFVAPISDFSVWVGVIPDGSRFEQLKQVVREDCAAVERCISPNVYRFHDGRWVIAD
jgi:hypothetical protein